jgi:hypothetical protein
MIPTARRIRATVQGIWPGLLGTLFLNWMIMLSKMPASANPIKPQTVNIANKNAIIVFIFHLENGAGAGFEPDSDLVRSCSPLSPRILKILNF